MVLGGMMSNEPLIIPPPFQRLDRADDFLIDVLEDLPDAGL